MMKLEQDKCGRLEIYLIPIFLRVQQEYVTQNLLVRKTKSYFSVCTGIAV